MGDHFFLSVESKDFYNLLHLLYKNAFISSVNIIKKEIIITFNNNLQKICQILQVSKLYFFLFLLKIFY